MIKVMIFDVGGVFITGSFDLFLRKISKILNAKIEKEKIEPITKEWMKGKLTFHKYIEKISGKKISEELIKEIFDIWTTEWDFDFEMIEFAKTFKGKYKVIMLSNADREGVERRDQKPFKFFDKKFLSFELGLTKPDREIYLNVLRDIHAKSEECVFIDDKFENVEAANKIGMKGIIYKNKKELEKELEKLGLIE